MAPENVTVIVVSLVVSITVLFGAAFAVYRWVMSPRAQRQYYKRHGVYPPEEVQGV